MILSTYLHQILNLLHFKFPIHQLHLPLSVMATLLSKAYVTPRISDRRHPIHAGLRTNSLKCYAQNPTPSNGSSSSPAKQESEPDNALLKLAWYGSEMLGIAASFFRSPPPGSAAESAADSLLSVDESGAVDRTALVATIKDDFQRSYFVTGNLTLGAYEEKCEFADPAGSFKGLQRFKRNCTNFGSLIEKCNMKLMKWEDFEDKGVGHWRFSCILSFPWRPILSGATGYTEYFFDAQSGKVCRHVEHWNVPKMTLLKQILKPSRRIRP